MSGHYPLEGVTVIDLGQIYNGPYCTFMMAMAGAKIIKIEAKGGEHLRRRGVVGGAALPFAMLNSNKTFATLNLKSERGRVLLKKMVRRGDVLVENFSPGAMERLGLGYDVMREVNPRLIYGAGSGYGRTGPNKDYPAMDLTVQAMAGIMTVTGYPDRPPVKAGPAMCDFFGGVHLYGAIMTALYEREKTGVGRLVEVSMQEAVYASLSSNLGLHYSMGETVAPRTGNRHGGLAEAPYNVYPTTDGYIAIICVGESHWKSLLSVMKRDDLQTDPRYADLLHRVENIDAIDELVSTFTSGYSKQALFELLMEYGVPCAPVRNLTEVVNDPHMHARRALEWVEHPLYGRVCLPNSPLRFDGVEPMEIKPSGELGRDNHAVYSDWLGLSDAEIQQLIEEEVI
ncbi:CoA transferase [Glaciimonas sp. CA11.2]|uniref:CaiB/BaiF CoA transferase family protein n=2 Tax=Oxalobacteraceae TaxID=75682 RepID=UPI002AB3F4DA|nr:MULTISPECIES: CoA transferase [unclassified Glaciimonas]MDY7546876.1 CoA transferase [Glaciimonas sp. CA11.2]MEB0012345.1 CoA transferase [Glaciimonas sp. Cout2]MEB0080469.1 CoA transferase [Glaciimonas sp. Gout2]MEB0161918.1 CoA transferase [Glaciimonas sp. CA11.2]